MQYKHLSGLVAAAAALLAASAQAAPVYSVTAPSGVYGVPVAFTATGDAGLTSTNTNMHIAPTGVAAGGNYLYVAPGGSISIAVNASTFSFLWGSVDAANTVTYHTTLGDFNYAGTDYLNSFGTGTSQFNALLAGGTIQSVDFASGTISFEFALPVPAANGVPEPATLALSLAAFGALAWTRRRKSSASR